MRFQEFKDQVGDGKTHFGYRSWVYQGNVKAYLRVTKRSWKGEIVRTVDFANGWLIDMSHEGQGHFAAFMKELQEWAGDLNRCVYVESVISPRLDRILSKLPGWERCGPEEGCPNFLFRPTART